MYTKGNNAINSRRQLTLTMVPRKGVWGLLTASITINQSKKDKRNVSDLSNGQPVHKRSQGELSIRDASMHRRNRVIRVREGGSGQAGRKGEDGNRPKQNGGES